MVQEITIETPDTHSPPGKMTYEEFLAWADEDTYAEWIDGEVIFLSPASSRHQDLAEFLIVLFRLFVEKHRLGVARIAPFQMKTGAYLSGREPDILFVANEHLDRLKDTYLDGPADLVVEIISPESGVRDRERKFNEYERGGVREYWVIDPMHKEADFYHLDEKGFYRAMSEEEGAFRGQVLEGFWLKVEWLWQEPLPPIMDVLKEWGLV